MYGLKTDEELAGPSGQGLRDCDMLGMISKDDPPVFVSVTRDAGPDRESRRLPASPEALKAIYDRCRELGTTVVADIPGCDIMPPTDGPATQARVAEVSEKRGFQAVNCQGPARL